MVMSAMNASVELVKELADVLACPLCWEEFTQPKVLQCKHVFCAGCLERLVANRRLVCPLCRREQVFSDNFQVSQLPEPLIITHMQEKVSQLLTASQDFVPASQVCGFCQDAATNFCLACVKNLCDECTRKHQTNRASKTHSLLEISKRTVCEVHPSDFVNTYCKSCKAGLCMMCVNTEHADHDIVDIHTKSFIDDTVKNLNSRHASLTSNIPRLESLRGETRKTARHLVDKYSTGSKDLELIRELFNTHMDKLQTQLFSNFCIQRQRLADFESDLNTVMVGHHSLLSYIEETRVKTSPLDLAKSADEILDASDFNVPSFPECNVPEISDTSKTNVTKYVHDLLNFLPFPPTPSLLDSVELTTVPPSDIEVSLASPTTSSDTLDCIDSVTHWLFNIDSLISTHTEDNLSSLGSTGDVIDKVTASPPIDQSEPPIRQESPVLGETTSPERSKVWESRFDRAVSDVVWDGECEGWWVRTGGEVYRCDCRGAVVAMVGKGILRDYGCVCININQGLVVTTDGGTRLVCMSRTGQVVRVVTGGGRWGKIHGVAFCHHHDLYIVSDVISDCLWYISASTGKILHHVGTSGTGNNEFDCPWSVYHLHRHTCSTLVSDYGNHCIKVLSSTREVIQCVPLPETADLRGLCVDPQGRVVTCDQNQRRVVYCRLGKQGVPMSRVILSTEGKPLCAAVSHDGRHLVVGMTGKEGVVYGFQYTSLLTTNVLIE